MNPLQNLNPKWRALLISGSSGVGKTVVSREISRLFGIPILLVDDVRLALQAGTTKDTNPDLHVFLQYREEQWGDAEKIVEDWIKVGKTMQQPLAAIVHHHIIVPGVGPVIIEGDGILPAGRNLSYEKNDVLQVLIIEEDENQLLENLRSRGRGFEVWDESYQKSFAHASWLYGQRLAKEAGKLGLPVVKANPRESVLERMMAVIIK